MKKPYYTKITEGKTTKILFDYFRLEKIKHFEIKNIALKVFEIFKKIDSENIDFNYDFNIEKYYKYIINHGIKSLLKKGIIERISEGKYKVLKYKTEPFEDIKTEKFSWETKNTVSNIYDFINDKKHLLPSFQRVTSWKREADYKELAFSIYNRVPLGIMYVWEIKKDEAIKVKHNWFKRDIKSNEEMNFLEANLNEYKQNTIKSVIDGQQRITGINVIINGTFNGKKLYFNENMQGSKKFAFKNTDQASWNKMEDIYNELKKIKNNNDNNDMINKISENIGISIESLKAFYNGFFNAHLLAICNIKYASLDEVLNVFIRTNKFGKKLNTADILLSHLVGENEEIGIKKKVENISKIIRNYKSDFSFASILKLISTYFTKNSKLDHNTFLEKNKKLEKKFDVRNITSWNLLKKSINCTIDLLKEENFDSKWINSDNSIIPIIFWHSRYLQKKIVNRKAKNSILNYLLWSQLLKHFSNSTDLKINKLINLISKEDFNGWKLGNKTLKSNIEELINKIDEINYETSKKKAFIILAMNENLLNGSNSIEHLHPQKKNGSHKIWNLALLPKNINSLIKDKSLLEKIQILMDKYKLSEGEIRKSLWIPEKANIKNIKNVHELRKNLLKKEIEKHLNNH